LLNINTRNLSTDDLFGLVKKRRVTYEQIRSVDPHRFQDLEFTMKMLYDHADIKGVDPSNPISNPALQKASKEREDQQLESQPQSKAAKATSDKASSL
jgi:hypothetical protein